MCLEAVCRCERVPFATQNKKRSIDNIFWPCRTDTRQIRTVAKYTAHPQPTDRNHLAFIELSDENKQQKSRKLEEVGFRLMFKSRFATELPHRTE